MHVYINLHAYPKFGKNGFVELFNLNNPIVLWSN